MLRSKWKLFSIFSISIVVIISSYLFVIDKNESDDYVFKSAMINDLRYMSKRINEGFYINAKNPNGDTLLMIASRYGNIDICKYLISKGAHLKMKNKLGEDIFLIAKKYKHQELQNYLKTLEPSVSERP